MRTDRGHTELYDGSDDGLDPILQQIVTSPDCHGAFFPEPPFTFKCQPAAISTIRTKSLTC